MMRLIKVCIILKCGNQSWVLINQYIFSSIVSRSVPGLGDTRFRHSLPYDRRRLSQLIVTIDYCHNHLLIILASFEFFSLTFEFSFNFLIVLHFVDNFCITKCSMKTFYICKDRVARHKTNVLVSFVKHVMLTFKPIANLALQLLQFYDLK